MKYPKGVWDQLKNVTVEDLIRALKKDSFRLDTSHGAQQVYYRESDNRRVVIHYHPKKTYRSASLLKGLIEDIGWSPQDMKRLKLIK